jgi:hypothetical protein
VPTASRPLTRRAVLALGVAGITSLTACSLVEDQVSGSPGKVAVDPDAALVDDVVGRISAAAAIAARVPQLSALHAAHLAALDADPTTTQAPAIATATEIRRSERDLKAFLVDASVQARSGPLARLFASMSAGITQQLVALPRELA